MTVRTGAPEDYPHVGRILANSPEAAQWLPEGYEFHVAECEGLVGGFLVWRRVAPDEIEILNLAVDPAFRRRGCAQALLASLPEEATFLEVRESNSAARALYRRAGFHEAGLRPHYYQEPDEGAVVMRLQS